MAASSAISMSSLACLLLNAWALFPCQTTNVQVESPDGSRHVFEMKTMDKTGAYLLCANCRSFPASSAPTPSALRFNVRFIPMGEIVSLCETHRKELPAGLCSPQGVDKSRSCPGEEEGDGGACTARRSGDGGDRQEEEEEVAEEIVRRNLLPFPSGDRQLDHSVAHAILEMNGGRWEKAVAMLNSLLDRYPENVAAHYARGVAYARRARQNQQYALQAVSDFSMCIDKEPDYPEGFERRAEIYITMNRFKEALVDLKAALALRSNSRVRFNIGIVNLFLENFVEAEAEFKKNLEYGEEGEKGHIYMLSYFYLGLAQYYQGRIRSAIEVFKEVLKFQPNHVEACISLAQAFKELGNYKAALTRFDQALALSPNHTLGLQLKGSLLYHSGDPASAQVVLQQCVKVDPEHGGCQYLLALTAVSLGQFYQGIKQVTKVMIKSLPEMKITPERVQAQYVREYGRFLHASLDEPVTQLKPEVALDEKIRASWVQGLPLTLRGQGVYREQPGLQPHIPDVQVDGSDLRGAVGTLLCFADRVGLSMQVSADGFLPNRRLNLALGLAAVHVAQLAEAKWRNLKGAGRSTERPFTWKELFSVAVRYRQLVDPEQPVFWVDSLPDYHSEEGHRRDITLIKGHVASVRVGQYFDLTFQLLRTMVQHYSGAGSVTYTGLDQDLEEAKTCQDLLDIARKRNIHPSGFLVSTQVPASIAVPPSGSSSSSSSSTSSSSESGHSSDNNRLDGLVLILTEDFQGRIVFTISIPSTAARTSAYGTQMDHWLSMLQQEVQKTGALAGGKPSDMDPILSAILSLIYYFYNLTPLTRGSSVVAYAVALGLIMSLGRQVSGKIPAGKVLDMEAMLSGTPDTFVAMMRQWLSVKKSTTPLSSLPLVWEAFPTVRSLLEALAVNSSAVCP